MIPTLVNDNAIELLKAQGKKAVFRLAKDDAEFFSLLKQKFLSDVQKMFDAKDRDKKLDSMIDSYQDLRVFMTKMNEFLREQGREMKTEIDKRYSKTGGFDKRIVIESVMADDSAKLDAAKEIMGFGEAHGYPRMNLGRNNSGQVYMTMAEGGKEWWEKMANSDHGEHLLNAVRQKDFYESQGEGKNKSG